VAFDGRCPSLLDCALAGLAHVQSLFKMSFAPSLRVPLRSLREIFHNSLDIEATLILKVFPKTLRTLVIAYIFISFT